MRTADPSRTLDRLSLEAEDRRMIDGASRAQAAKIVRQFRDGIVTSDDLEAEWPISDDLVIDALASMLWRFYDDHRPRRMVGRKAPSSGEQEALTRYAAFLDSDLPYEWPQSRFDRIGGLGLLNVLSLGLLLPLDWWIKHRDGRFQAALDKSGDFSVWPFLRRSDYVLPEAPN